MACWITDGSSGFSINGNVVTVAHIDEQQYMYNAMWQDGNGVLSGKHYWKIHFLTLTDIASVGLTSKECLKQGYACQAILYSGNLTNCSGRLVGSFGPSPKEGDVIGILAIFESDRLKVYIDVNGKSLGLAFNVPASTFNSIYPIVSFNDSGSATCTKQTEIPDIFNRAPTTFAGIEGDWKLTDFQENGVMVDIPCSSTSSIALKEANRYTWHVSATNSYWTTLYKEDGNWKTSDTLRTLMGILCPKLLKFECSMSVLMSDVKIIEIDESGHLSIKSDKISSTWSRNDTAPGPYVGEPFALFR